MKQSPKLLGIDLENMLAGEIARIATTDAHAAYIDLRQRVRVRPTDHTIIAVHPSWAFLARELDPGARIVTRTGRDGADIRLARELEDVEFIRRRYSEVVIASGDHSFLETLNALSDAGLTTTIAGLPGCTSAATRLAAHRTVWLRRPATAHAA